MPLGPKGTQIDSQTVNEKGRQLKQRIQHHCQEGQGEREGGKVKGRAQLAESSRVP